MKYSRQIFGAVLLLALASLIVWLPSDVAGPASQPDRRSAVVASSSGRAQPNATDTGFFASDPVTPSITMAASELPAAVVEYTLDREINPRMGYNTVADPNFNPAGGPDPLLAVQEAAPPASPNAFGTPLLNFNGQGYTGVNPPDTIGDVGPSHYIQMINGGGGALVQIYNKSTGAPIGGQFALNDLATGGACQSGLGDPIVLYDKLADRWLLSEFASTGNHLCVYVSRTNNPAGQYYFYDFTTPVFPDYPKYAVWPDAYYVSTNETNPTAYALDRLRMVSGLAATFQRFTAPDLPGFGFQALTPADLDGSTPPPGGTPGLFMRHRDTEVHGPSGLSNRDLLELWTFSVNWTTPASSSFVKAADIQVAEFDSTLCGLTGFSCVPQPGTSVRIDPLREVVMWRLAYRNFANRQVLVGNFVTDVDGNNRAGVRWFELRKTSNIWSLYQEGTFAPGSTLHRWMGAIAMDGSGNIALGYNVSDSAVYPGLRYVGRLASDALGTLPQGEHTLINGTGSNGSVRYGDYSAMSVDPSDDCTFWFTGEWNAASTWSTRIGKFRFDPCGQASLPARAYLPMLYKVAPPTTGTVTGLVRRVSNSDPIPGAQVCVVASGQCASTNSQGAYTISNVLAGSQTIRASASGFITAEQAVTVPAGGSATANFLLTAGGLRTITHSQSQAITSGNSVSCNLSNIHTANAYLREFDLASFGIVGAFEVSTVEFGVESANAGTGASQPLRVRLYRKINPAGSLTYANLATVTTANVSIPDQGLTRYAAPIAGTIPAGSVLVVEVFTPSGAADGHSFFIGSNAAGQTAPSYLAAAECGVPEPVSVATIGFPDMHVVMNVTGTTGLAELETCVTIGDEASGNALCRSGDAPVVETSVAPQATGSNDNTFQWRTRSGSQNK